MDKYLEQLLQTMLFSFVEKPDVCAITTDTSPRGICITLSVAASDMGIVIGKNGQMFQALRGILRSAGSKAGVIVNLVVSEPTK